MTYIKDPMLNSPLPAIDDREGENVPESMPSIIDAHVHFFPDGIFNAVWKWFEEHGWPIRHKLTAVDIVKFLLSHGIDHIVGLQYAHKPGIAHELNLFMIKLCHQFPQKLTGMATVFPGEDDSGIILEDAFKLGLQGVKLHSHVQHFDMNSADMDIIYEICSSHQKPLLKR